MARKPAVMYREIKGMAYTRREYMGGVPNSRISQFDMGNLKDEFPITLTLKCKNRVQIRHTSLEAGRIAANRVLTKDAGVANYHLKLRAYPHVVLRENKLATGAGADRGRGPRAGEVSFPKKEYRPCGKSDRRMPAGLFLWWKTALPAVVHCVEWKPFQQAGGKTARGGLTWRQQFSMPLATKGRYAGSGRERR